MPGLDKASRRDKKREKNQKMGMSGRGLITSGPNWERREAEAQKKKLRKAI